MAIPFRRTNYAKGNGKMHNDLIYGTLSQILMVFMIRLRKFRSFKDVSFLKE